MTVYQQLTRGLRWSLGPGQGDFFSERPTDSKGRFTDGEAGTTVEIPDGAPVDVAFLLQIGAIAPLENRPSAKEEPGGEGPG